MRGCPSSPLLLFLLFCLRLFGSKPVSSEPHMARTLRYMATERTGGVFQSYKIPQKSSKRICAYLTSPLDGEITECCWAAMKSCDWRLSGQTWVRSHEEEQRGHKEPGLLIWLWTNLSVACCKQIFIYLNYHQQHLCVILLNVLSSSVCCVLPFTNTDRTLWSHLWDADVRERWTDLSYLTVLNTPPASVPTPHPERLRILKNPRSPPLCPAALLVSVGAVITLDSSV